MTDDADREFLDRLHGGGDAALAELFSHYHDKLERMVRFRMDPRLSARVDVADVLQEAYLDAAKRLPSYLANPAAPLFVWLRGIAANTLVDVHRRHLGAGQRDAGRDVSLFCSRVADASSEMMALELVGQLTSPSQAAMRDEAAAQVGRALSQMDQIDREVLALRHFEHLGNQEVADVLGISKTAASNRYVRALGRLREILVSIPGLMDQEC